MKEPDTLSGRHENERVLGRKERLPASSWSKEGQVYSECRKQWMWN